ncbi:AAA family ATPase [Robbsia andropogonis]|uniref:AAA family ATPase n=1 Tax=Robbsia andropogonis TaxID=28092 RepID=UPI003D1BE4F1
MASMIPDDVNFDEYLTADDDGMSKVRPASEFVDGVIAMFHEQAEASLGSTSPWPKVGDKVRFRSSEVSLWAGINGHGKSGALGYVISHILSQGGRACIASMEMKPEQTMGRMTRQAAGNACPTPKFIADFHTWTDDRLWIYNQVGQVDWRRMVAVARYCRNELGIDHIVIDSMMKCGIKPDDYGTQKEFVDALCTLAKDTGIHVHLVHHMRKGEREMNKVPDKFDIKGAGEIVDLVDNAFIVYRNKAKEEIMQRERDPEKRKAQEQIPDVMLICAKQRHHGWEGTIRLWFDPASQQLLEDPRSATQYLDLNTSTWKTQWSR